MRPTVGLVLALTGAFGVFLLYTWAVLGWQGLGVGPTVADGAPKRDRLGEWLAQAGLADVRLVDLMALSGVLFVVGAGLAWFVFGGVLPPLVVGSFAGAFPVAGAHARRERRRLEAREAWPRMIEEIRLQATTMGRSLPQALFAVGRRAPEEMRPAFDAAHREWLLTTDFARTLAVLRAQLADATADAVCETLLVANEVGGSGTDRRLAALIDDRIDDLQGRKDAEAKQAGARFARRFVLLVPLGMALAGLSIGSGRAAYQTPLGQTLVVTGLGLVAVCWVWAGRIMRLPAEQRVFYEEQP
jgi:tight adherence protein B